MKDIFKLMFGQLILKYIKQIFVETKQPQKIKIFFSIKTQTQKQEIKKAKEMYDCLNVFRKIKTLGFNFVFLIYNT